MTSPRLGVLFILLLAIALLGCVEMGTPRKRNDQEEKPNAQDGTLKMHYHRFVLLKYKGKIIAIHVLPDPAHGHDGIDYRWYHLTDGTDRFYRPSPSEADASPNPALKTGSGETHEDKDSKEGVIKAGPLAIPWSKGNHQLGWLYLFRAAKEIEVYPIQFERLEDCSGKLKAARWIKLKAKSAEPLAPADRPRK